MAIPKDILAVKRPSSTVVKQRGTRFVVIKRTSKRADGKIKGSSGIWSDGHNLHYINSKHDDVQLRTIGNSLIFSCSIFVES